MSAISDRPRLDAEPEAISVSGTAWAGHAANAARRLSWAQAGLTLLALVSFALVFLRLFERWRVTAHGASHRVAILGEKLTYPAANLAAVAVLTLALLGAIAAAIAVVRAVREVRATKRFARRLAGGHEQMVDGAFVVDDARPQAFCLGLLQPRVYLTTGALAILDDEALEAVLRHERHHARRRDPLRLAAYRILATALFFLPGLAELARQHETLAEINADEAAMSNAPAGRSALARAMLSFSDSPDAGQSAGIDPARLDHLLREQPSWRFPTLLVLLAFFLLGLLAAVAALAGQAAAGAASLAPPFLSAQPCVVVLALIPAGLALGAVGVIRSKRALRRFARHPTDGHPGVAEATQNVFRRARPSFGTTRRRRSAVCSTRCRVPVRLALLRPSMSSRRRSWKRSGGRARLRSSS